MDWQREATEDLVIYKARKAAIENLQEDLKMIESKLESPAGGTYGDTPVRGSGSPDDKIIGLIDRKGRIEDNLNDAKKFCNSIERGLAILDEEHRLILQRMYIDTPKSIRDAALRVGDLLHVDLSTVYRMRYDALYRFTVARYGYINK